MTGHAEPPTGPADRIDRALVSRGLARSRAHAGDLVRSGAVRLDGARVFKPATPVTPVQLLKVDADPGTAWVSRGAVKLDGALRAWSADGLMVAGRRCADVGASTGGFTQVLLARGARSVLALDVGHGQLAPEVQDHPRVTECSGVNVREVTPDRVVDLAGPFDLVVADLSFISLTLVLDTLRPLTCPDGDTVVLVKPQFEVGRARVGRNGVVRRPEDRVDSVVRVAVAAVDGGWSLRSAMPSSLPGTHGNREYLLWLGPPEEHAESAEVVRSRVSALVEEGGVR